jgi:hypothetical protein
MLEMSVDSKIINKTDSKLLYRGFRK